MTYAVARRSIDEVLQDRRAGLRRVTAVEAYDALQGGAVLVDVRPEAQRRDHGVIEAAVVVDRNVLEWRLDPASPHRLPWVTYGTRVIVVCQQGYSSSLAAATLQELGLAAATDLVGGFEAWQAAGLPVSRREIVRDVRAHDRFSAP